MMKKCKPGFVRKKDKCVRKTSKNSNTKNKKDTPWFLLLVIVGFVILGIWYFFGDSQEGGPYEGLLAYYNFESNASNTLLDQHGDYNGVIVGNAEVVTGKVGNAYSFERGDGYVNVGDEFDGLINFTICFWFKSHHYGPQYMLGKYQDATTHTFYAIVHNGSISQGLVQYKTYGFNSTDSYALFPNMHLNAWYLFCGINDGTSQKLYINASNVHNATTNYAVLQNNTLDFEIGGLTAISTFANVTIDEMGIWDRELTGSEIIELYNYGEGYEYTGFV